MKNLITILLILSTFRGYAQLSLSTGVDFFVLTTFKNGSDRVQSRKPFPWSYYEAQNIAAPSFNVSYAKRKANGLGLGINTGLSFYGTKAVADYGGTDELYSEIKFRMINVPLTGRVTVDIGRLIDQTIYLEAGFINAFVLKYQLSEIASIKTLDANNNVVGEDLYKSNQQLVKSPFYRLMPTCGFGASVRRLRIGLTYAFSILDWYRPLTSNDVPPQYSMYELKHSEKGKLKFNFFSVNVSMRLTKH